MIGLRGKTTDTSNWTTDDFRRAHRWNLAFFLGWLVFFTFPIAQFAAGANWIMLVLTVAIGLFGSVFQAVVLYRGFHFLRGLPRE